MDNNEKGETVTENSEKNEVLEELNSHKRKFDEIAGKLQSMEKSIAKIPKFDEKPKSEKRFVLKHVFRKVDEFEEGVGYFSETECHFNVNWCMYVKRNNGHLGYYIHCEPIAPANKWSIQTKLEYKVVGKNQNDVIRTWETCYEENIGRGFIDFQEWEEMKKWYLLDGNLTVEAKITIIRTTGLGKAKIREFDKSQKDVSDVLLVVQDAKFYVPKTYLAAQSAFFKTLLFGNFSESSQSEVVLSEIDPNDFQCFLEVLYGEPAIDDSTVDGILHIADMYATPMVVRKCEEFLLEKSAKSAKKRLELAARYNFESLKKKCMSGIETLADFQSILPDDIQTFSPSVIAELLEKTRTLH